MVEILMSKWIETTEQLVDHLKNKMFAHQEQINTIQKTNLIDLRGRRQSIQNFAGTTNQLGDIAEEFIDSAYYINK